MSIRNKIKAVRNSLGYKQGRLKINLASQFVKIMSVKGVSKSALAESLECRPSYITKILQGDENMSINTIAKVAHALGHDVEVKLVEQRKSFDWGFAQWQELYNIRTQQADNVFNFSDYGRRVA